MEPPLFEEFPDGVTLHESESGEIVAANASFCAMLGYEKEEVLDGSFAEICINEPPYTVDRAREYIERAKTEGPQTFEWVDETKDGEPVPVEVHLRQITLEGVDHVLAVIRDITGRKERERRLEALNETAHDLMMADSREAVAEIGVTAAKDILGLDANAIHLHDEAASTLVPVVQTEEALDLIGKAPSLNEGECIAWRVFETGESLALDDVHTDPDIFNPDTVVKSELYLPIGDIGILIAASPSTMAFDEEDVLLGEILTSALAAAFEQVSRTEQIRSRETELMQQNERLEEFASIISHDLRNPLNVAALRLNLVEQECDSEHLTHIKGAHERMEALIDDLLTLARAEEPINDTESVALESVTNACEKQIETADATISTDLDQTIQADSVRLEQLLENLLRNAVEHGGENVTIRVGDLPDGFYVEDTGPGIPESARSEVFRGGYSTKEQGTGLGLRIVEQVVDAHGWDIEVTEGSDGGARFEITGVEILE